MYQVLDTYILLDISRALSKEKLLSLHTQILEAYSSEQRQGGTLTDGGGGGGTAAVGRGKQDKHHVIEIRTIHVCETRRI